MESLLVHSTRMQIAGNNNYWTLFSLRRTRFRRDPAPIRHHPLRCRTDRHRPCWLKRSVANSAGQQAPHTRSKYPHLPQENSGRSLTGSSERYRLIPFLHPSEAITNKTWSQVHSGSELPPAHYALFSLFLKCRTRHAKFLATPINGYQARAPRHLFFRQPARYREKPHPE